MAIKLGNTAINKIYLGSTEIKKAYLGDTLVFGGAVVEFISLWETTTANETITLPTAAGDTWDWGDGTINQENSHEYTDAGQYTIKTADAVSFTFNNQGDKLKILNISSWGAFIVGNLCFHGCTNLYITDSSSPIVNSLFYVFASNVPVGIDINWDTPNITGTGSMFRSNTVFNQNVTLDGTSLTSTGEMFYVATAMNSNVTITNTTNLTSVVNMFIVASRMNGIIDIEDTSNVTSWYGFLDRAVDYRQSLNHLSFASATNLNRFMTGVSLYPSQYYDELLIKWDSQLVFANMININIVMGSNKYTAAGATAHVSLISKGFIIIDGGQV